MNHPVSDGHIELKEIQFWSDDEARYAYLINYATEDEERALFHDSVEEEVVYGVRQRGTGIYCEIERREIKNERSSVRDC